MSRSSDLRIHADIQKDDDRVHLDLARSHHGTAVDFEAVRDEYGDTRAVAVSYVDGLDTRHHHHHDGIYRSRYGELSARLSALEAYCAGAPVYDRYGCRDLVYHPGHTDVVVTQDPWHVSHGRPYQTVDQIYYPAHFDRYAGHSHFYDRYHGHHHGYYDRYYGHHHHHSALDHYWSHRYDGYRYGGGCGTYNPYDYYTRSYGHYGPYNYGHYHGHGHVHGGNHFSFQYGGRGTHIGVHADWGGHHHHGYAHRHFGRQYGLGYYDRGYYGPGHHHGGRHLAFGYSGAGGNHIGVHADWGGDRYYDGYGHRHGGNYLAIAGPNGYLETNAPGRLLPGKKPWQKALSGLVIAGALSHLSQQHNHPSNLPSRRHNPHAEEHQHRADQVFTERTSPRRFSRQPEDGPDSRPRIRNRGDAIDRGRRRVRDMADRPNVRRLAGGPDGDNRPQRRRLRDMANRPNIRRLAGGPDGDNRTRSRPAPRLRQLANAEGRSRDSGRQRQAQARRARRGRKG